MFITWLTDSRETPNNVGQDRQRQSAEVPNVQISTVGPQQYILTDLRYPEANGLLSD